MGTGDGSGFGDRRCSATRSTRLDGGRRKVGPSGRVTGMLQVVERWRTQPRGAAVDMGGGLVCEWAGVGKGSPRSRKWPQATQIESRQRLHLGQGVGSSFNVKRWSVVCASEESKARRVCDETWGGEDVRRG